MFGSGILDTVIGLIFVFLLVSMLVTISNELIAGALGSRAKYLKLGLERLLGTDWARAMFAHPLIGGAQELSARHPAGGYVPSYIASRSFANVLMALLHDSAGSVRQVRRTLQAVITGAVDSGATVETLKRQVAAALPNINRLVLAHSHAALAEAITRDLASLGERLKTPYTVADAQADIQRLIDGMQTRYLREMIEGLPDARMRDALLALFEDAQNDVEKFKENIEIWFNNSMDRISGWYKRRSQRAVVVLAVIAAVGVNVDAILIVKHLQANAGARESLVAQAKVFADKAPSMVDPTTADPARPSIASGDNYKGTIVFSAPAATDGDVKLASDIAGVKVTPASATVQAGDTGVPFTVETVLADTPAVATISAKGAAQGVFHLEVRPSLSAQFTGVQKSLKDLGLPIGWVARGTPAQEQNGQVMPRTFADGVDRMQQHLIGWLITALAATLGAPFWFDMLNRIISIRSTGKAPEEKPKSPKEVSTPVEPGQTPREADRAAARRD